MYMVDTFELSTGCLTLTRCPPHLVLVREEGIRNFQRIKAFYLASALPYFVMFISLRLEHAPYDPD